MSLLWERIATFEMLLYGYISGVQGFKRELHKILSSSSENHKSSIKSEKEREGGGSICYERDSENPFEFERESRPSEINCMPVS